MKIREPKLTKTAKKIVKKRYLRTDLDGNIIETPGEMFARVAKHFAKAEINWGSADTVEKITQDFYQLMVDTKLIPGGKALFEAGNPGGNGQLSSCFVLPIKDDMKQIFKTLGDAALVHKNNGGTGFNFSAIRRRGDKVKNVPNAASGPVDFISVFSAALSKILQGSKRQGANIGILNCDHPDIIDFITLKDEDGTIKNFNISVGVTNQFFEAVQRNKTWELKNPRNNQVVKKIPARELFDLIAHHAWSTGDPGLAFLDRMQADNPTPSIGPINATNPCGEIPLLPYESCNLASIVLSNHILTDSTSGEVSIDWHSLEHTIKTGIRLLDNMIEVNTYALPEIESMVKNGNRRIGLGVMGFAHLLYKLNIPYDSNEAVRLAERLAKFIRRKSEEMSLVLGKQRGVFPNWDQSIYAGTAEKYRNCALNMIAPTGTISMLSNCSSGIEPVFSLVTKRRTFFEDDKQNRPTQELFLIDPIFEQYLEDKLKQSLSDQSKVQAEKTKLLDQISQSNSLDGIELLTAAEKRIFTTTHHIKPKWHIRIQAAWQKYFDNSVSKTINFPHDATIKDVKQAYLQAWKQGCKGITIYRDGSKQDQVLNLSSKQTSTKPVQTTKTQITIKQPPDNQITPHILYAQDHAQAKSPQEQSTTKSTINQTHCPECQSQLKQTNSLICLNCGWSKNHINL